MKIEQIFIHDALLTGNIFKEKSYKKIIASFMKLSRKCTVPQTVCNIFLENSLIFSEVEFALEEFQK